MTLYRPAITGTRHTIVSGHYLATSAGFQILESGGNAVDAGCAAGIALGVLQSELVNFAGVAPIILYDAQTDRVHTISGLGSWPKRITSDLFTEQFNGQIPESILRTVVPAAPDSWLTALELFGTMSFSEVSAAARRFASEGFVMYPLMAENIDRHSKDFGRWESNSEIYLPNGRPPIVGEIFIQADLGRTLQYMADEESACTGDRVDGLQAARDAFYRGDIASKIIEFHNENGGFLRADDLEEFRVTVENPLHIEFMGTDVFTCGPWCQGPTLLQILKLLERFDLTQMGHNSPSYIHTLTEAIKLAFADRHFFYGDPQFINVPIDALISTRYNEAREKLIRPTEAWPGLPPAGDPLNYKAYGQNLDNLDNELSSGPKNLDTSYVCVTDSAGNIFSCTPSDVANESPVIPGTGLCPSSRGSSSWANPHHASSVQAGKRPRLTPNPALAIHKNHFSLPFGTPGGDIQVQAMIQCFLNVVLWEMDPQEAVEQPRFGSYSFPNTFEPHDYHPGKLMIESRLADDTIDQLLELGHKVEKWPDWTWEAGGVGMIKTTIAEKIHIGGADPRRPTYAIGW